MLNRLLLTKVRERPNSSEAISPKTILMIRDNLSWRHYVVPAPDLEPGSQYKDEDCQH